MAQTFKKGDTEVKLDKPIEGTDVFKTSLGDFSIADLKSQGFSPVDIPTENTSNTQLDIEGVGKSANQTETFDRNKLKTDIETSLTKAGDNALANDAFIQAVSKYAKNRPASKDELMRIGENKFGLVGAGVNDVLRRFGIAEDFGRMLDTPKEDTLTGGGGVDETTPKKQDIIKPKTAQDKIADLYTGLSTNLSKIKTQAREDVELDAKSQAIADASLKVNELRTELQNQQLEFIKEEDAIRGKPLLTSQIQGQLNKMSREQKLDAMFAQNAYNNAVLDLQVAQGNYDRAKEIVTETANDFYQNAQFQLDALQAQDVIEQREYERLQSNLQYDRDLRLEGFIPMTIEQANEQGLLRADLYIDPMTGQSYKRPTVSDYEIIKNELELQKLFKEV